jgi:methionyl-tRNA formyltransferase
MRIVFCGTPLWAVPFLQVCCQSGEVVAVVTAPDRPRGRGRRLQPTPVKEFALRQGLPVLQPLSCREASLRSELACLGAEVLVVVAYGQLLPGELLELFDLALNVHFSLLPQLRGAAPVQRALQWGFRQTGVTVQRLAEALDAGDVLRQAVVPVRASDDAQHLIRRLVEVGTSLLREVLEAFGRGKPLPAQPQDPALATYAPKVDKSDCAVCFAAPATLTARQIQACSPAPGASCFAGRARLKIAGASAVWFSAPAAPEGEVLLATLAGPVVGCGGHGLVIERGQREGGGWLSGAELVRGRIIAVGQRLQSGPSLGPEAAEEGEHGS